jgi:ABC-type Fe3+ transport system substrate-binding protein
MMSGLAQQLVDYILSGEGQAVGRRYGLFPTRTGAQPPTGAPRPPAELEAPTAEAQPPDLREKLRRLFGG